MQRPGQVNEHVTNQVLVAPKLPGRTITGEMYESEMPFDFCSHIGFGSTACYVCQVPWNVMAILFHLALPRRSYWKPAVI